MLYNPALLNSLVFWGRGKEETSVGILEHNSYTSSNGVIKSQLTTWSVSDFGLAIGLWVDDTREKKFHS